MIWVLDASALVAWLRGEPGGRRVAEILGSGDRVLLHVVNLIEVLYHFLRQGQAYFDTVQTQIDSAPIAIVSNVDEEMVATAVLLKATQTPIALGDVFAVSLASTRAATLLTSDRGELQKVSDAGLCMIDFIR